MYMVSLHITLALTLTRQCRRRYWRVLFADARRLTIRALAILESVLTGNTAEDGATELTCLHSAVAMVPSDGGPQWRPRVRTVAKYGVLY